MPLGGSAEMSLRRTFLPGSSKTFLGVLDMMSYPLRKEFWIRNPGAESQGVPGAIENCEKFQPCPCAAI
jgi:hypothetical protein